MTRRERRRFAASLTIAAVVGLLLTVALWNQFFKTFQSSATDIFFQTWDARGVREVADSVVIVAIDDASIHRLGRFGDWPRAHYARAVDHLREAHARVLVFDIGFFEPHPDDAAVASAFRRFMDVAPEELQRAGVPINRRAVISPVVGSPNTARTSRAGSPTQFPDLLQPQPIYIDSSTALGHANVIPDGDGTVRKTPLLFRVRDRDVPSLSLAAGMAYTNTLGRGYAPDADAIGVRAANRLVPTDPFFNMIVSFAGPPSRTGLPGAQTFKLLSFVDVLDGRVDPAALRDKIVFLGVLDATGFADDYQVPTSAGLGKMHGVEIHANAFSTIVSARYFTDPDFAVTAAIVWLFCIATGAGVARFSIVPSAVAALGAGLLYFFGSLLYAGLSYDPMGVTIPNLVYPPLALLLTFLSVSVYRIVFEQAEARATRGAMGKYLSPAVLEEVLKDPDQLRLGGEKRVMTVLFTDIRGFTSISEQLDPETLVALLNEYLTVMTNIVHAWQGVLDKYMGDAIMAWWGAPTEQPDHAYHACRAALEMRQALHQLHVGWSDRGVPRLEMGVGINTGPMVYGNTGSHERFDFTVLGDSVNLASRLEGANKEYRSNVIISEATYEQVKDRGFITRFLDVIAVKGKTEPVRIYELMGAGGDGVVAPAELLAGWASAMAMYRAREFSLAIEAFDRLLDMDPTDGPASIYADRCRDLQEDPPAPDWDGVYVMTHK